ncbi:hypothetical protein EH221_03580 [bacterium]|nr:MAG: hypothetical protein EH221_03580 [bacterium]
MRSASFEITIGYSSTGSSPRPHVSMSPRLTPPSSFSLHLFQQIPYKIETNSTNESERLSCRHCRTDTTNEKNSPYAYRQALNLIWYRAGKRARASCT